PIYCVLIFGCMGLSGKAQTTAIAVAIARICNVAWRAQAPSGRRNVLSTRSLAGAFQLFAQPAGGLDQAGAGAEEGVGVDAVYMGPRFRGQAQRGPLLPGPALILRRRGGRQDDVGPFRQDALDAYGQGGKGAVLKDVDAAAGLQGVVQQHVLAHGVYRRVADRYEDGYGRAMGVAAAQ